jgi:hypothetical protein
MNLENTKPDQPEVSDYTPTSKEQNDISYAVEFKRECEQQTQKEK